MKQNRMTRQPPEEIQPFLDNPFLKDFRGRDIIYTKDFYVAMYKKISEEHMIKLNRQDYTDDSYSWIVGIEQYDFPSSSFGKSGELLMPLFNEILGVMGVPSNVISSALSGLTGVVTKENASTDAYYVSCEFSLLEEARFDKIETGLPIVFQLDHNSNYTGYSDYASSTEIMYRTYFKPHSANKGTYYYTSCEDTFIPFQITLPE